MKKISTFLLFFVFILFTDLKISLASQLEHKIIVLVNENIITSFDIAQRIKINAIINNVKIDKSNMNIIRNSVINELIDEKLKIEKSNEFNMKINKEEYLKYETDILNQIGILKDDLMEIFENNNINYNGFKDFVTSQIMWQKVIGGLYYRLVSASDLEVNEVLYQNPTISIDQAKQIVIQKQLDLKSSKLLRDLKNEATIEIRN